MFSMKDVPQLVRNDTCVANLCIDIPMRVAVNPIVDARLCDVVSQFHSKSTIYQAVAELRSGA